MPALLRVAQRAEPCALQSPRLLVQPSALQQIVMQAARPGRQRFPVFGPAVDLLRAARGVAVPDGRLRRQHRVLVSVPMPSMLTSTTSPGFSQVRSAFGRSQATPLGVPVKIRSPGSSFT